MNLTLLFSCIIFSFSILSQSKGYFGKKNIFEFGFTIQNPVLYNFKISSDSYNLALLNKKGALINDFPQLNYGFNMSIGRMLENNFGVIFEGGINQFSVVPNISSASYGNINKFNTLMAEMIDVKKNCFMPKIEFSSNDALLPMGISNQIGFGINYYKPISKDYIGTVKYGDSTISVSKNNYYDFNSKSIKGYTLMYKLTLRIPLNEKLLYHFGFRYTANFVPSFYSDIVSPNEILSQSNMRNMIKLRENRNLINFDTGITFCF
jgi:hypothetical protein